jgi:flagellar motor switch protein FliN/FliY
VNPNLLSDEPMDDEDDFSIKPSELEGITVNPASFAELQPKKPAVGKARIANGRTDTTSLEMLLDIGLQVTIELGRARMTIKEVLSLGPGTVVELNRVAGEPVDILINGKAIAKGEVVVLGDMFGVRVTDIIPPAQRVESMM